MSDYLYHRLIQQLSEEIESGRLKPGSRMPSVRALSQQQQISRSTVLAAYDRLEADGMISARPRSGYYVNTPSHGDELAVRAPSTSRPQAMPLPVTAGQVLIDIMDRGAAFDLISQQDQSLADEHLRRCLARAQRRLTNNEQLNYDEPAGMLHLRELLAQRLLLGGSLIRAEDLLITSGCQNGLLLALMATTQRGDVVAVESPGFYGVFQLIEALGLKALEMPCSADQGMSADALELALQHWDIKAVMLSPSFSTPTGACMPEDQKQRILALTQQRNIAIIEDDIYGELGFREQRPRTLHSYDNSGSVLLCSSFSKSLSRDLRVGWILPGKYRERVKQLKLVTSLASCQAQQRGLSYFLEEGSLERHLRLRRQQLKQQYQQLLVMINEHLPMAQSCSRPQGGLSLWLELPNEVDTLKLYQQALHKGIVLTPGRLFSAQEHYRNALRMSFAHPWTQPRQEALAELGAMLAKG
ncbi:MAG: PLP-dependent aminotransferase family protein [Motiliproteus sp.]|nr:PLP-dependent aminotransferase family protein [Motiliproteus sp.]MCW9051207.1 PLP-dependent aminotransferase family protein [Motiliproteus sp.]